MSIFCFHNGTVLNGINTFKNAAVLISKNKIIDVFNESRFEKKCKAFPKETVYIDVKGAFISPGFIDTHIHGTGGHGTDKLLQDQHSLLHMAKILPQYGVTSFLPTLYPKPVDDMNTILVATVYSIEQQQQLTPSTERGATMAGIHLEGPFISTKRLGVHKPECVHTPDEAVMNEFIRIGKGYIKNMTVAPELKGMHEIAILGANANIVMQAGHTDAEYEHIIEGMQVGILHSTHFFNAMSRLHHRNPGTVGAILLNPSISCEIIADGFHVHPLLVKLLLNNKILDNIVLVTDALSPAHQQGDMLMANNDEVYLKNDIFYRKKDDVIAGSSLSMIQGIKNLTSWDVATVGQAVAMASSNPARIMKIPNKGSLLPDYDADITVFDNNYNILYTMIEGELVYTK